MKLKTIILALAISLVALSAGLTGASAQNNGSSPAPGMDGLDLTTFKNTCMLLGGSFQYGVGWKCVFKNYDGTTTVVTCDVSGSATTRNCRSTTYMVKTTWKRATTITGTGLASYR